jgi:hypothetical protein
MGMASVLVLLVSSLAASIVPHFVPWRIGECVESELWKTTTPCEADLGVFHHTFVVGTPYSQILAAARSCAMLYVEVWSGDHGSLAMCGGTTVGLPGAVLAARAPYQVPAGIKVDLAIEAAKCWGNVGTRERTWRTTVASPQPYTTSLPTRKTQYHTKACLL